VWSVSFSTLALIGVIALVGPLLALPLGWHVPVLIGELLAGIVFGPTGFDVLKPQDPTFAFLAQLGFALVMFVAGSRVPVRDPRIRGALRTGALRAVGVGVLAVPAGIGISALFHTGHPSLYAVILASSSAAIVLPVVDAEKLSGPAALQLLPQVAIADTACVVALPLAVDPAHAGRAALGAVAVLAGAAVLYVVLSYFERSGQRKRLHKVSEERKFALELRINLVLLFALAALATLTHVSVLLAGFSFGLAVAAIGEPRRLARQLFALNDGFLGPVFFVWLGATLNLRDLGRHPSFIVLGLVLGVGAVVIHALMRLTGQPIAYGAIAAAQMGVPVAAAAVGTQLHLLAPGESTALILGALITVAVTVAAAVVAAREPQPAMAPAPVGPSS
jgi:Kef-type K+ transport system membrane component KefB